MTTLWCHTEPQIPFILSEPLSSVPQIPRRWGLKPFSLMNLFLKALDHLNNSPTYNNVAPHFNELSLGNIFCIFKSYPLYKRLLRRLTLSLGCRFPLMSALQGLHSIPFSQKTNLAHDIVSRASSSVVVSRLFSGISIVTSVSLGFAFSLIGPWLPPSLRILKVVPSFERSMKQQLCLNLNNLFSNYLFRIHFSKDCAFYFPFFYFHLIC